jgi:hypothetical protein
VAIKVFEFMVGVNYGDEAGTVWGNVGICSTREIAEAMQARFKAEIEPTILEPGVLGPSYTEVDYDINEVELDSFRASLITR